MLVFSELPGINLSRRELDKVLHLLQCTLRFPRSWRQSLVEGTVAWLGALIVLEHDDRRGPLISESGEVVLPYEVVPPLTAFDLDPKPIISTVAEDALATPVRRDLHL